MFASISELWAAYHRELFFLLFVAGLLLRLATAFLFGTQDVEFWKAYLFFGAKRPWRDFYGCRSDAEVLQALRESKWNYLQALKTTVSQADFPQARLDPRSTEYWQKTFVCAQPPLYFYLLAAVGRVLIRFDPEVRNTRWLNFYVNLIAIAFSLGISLSIYLFLRPLLGLEAALAAVLVYWLNPVVILSSPVQGFFDPLPSLPALLSIMFLYNHHIVAAMVCLAIAMLMKPQGVFIAPVVVVGGLVDAPFAENVLAWGAAAVVCFAAFAPYLINRRFASAVLNILGNGIGSQDLSRQSMNIWWILQYLCNALAAREKGIASTKEIWCGGRTNWFGDYPSANVAVVPVKKIGFTLLLVFTIINLVFLARFFPVDPAVVFFAAFFQIYGYFNLRVGVQNNHYFLAIPILSVLVFLKPGLFPYYVAISLIFFLQDFIFYGFGRDWNRAVDFLSNRWLGWTTLILAAANAKTFILLCLYAFLGFRFYFAGPGL